MGAGALIAELGADINPFKRKVDEATKYAGKKLDEAGGDIAKHMGQYFTGGAILGGTIEFFKTVADEVGRIKDASEQFGITTDDVQKLTKAAKSSGIEFEAVGTALDKLGSARKSAVESSQELRDTFYTLGVSLEDLQNPGKSDLELFRQIAHALDNLNGSAQRQALRELLGKSGGRLLEVMRELDQQGPINLIEEDQIKRIDQATKKLEELWRQIKVGGAKVTNAALTDKGGLTLEASNHIFGPVLTTVYGLIRALMESDNAYKNSRDALNKAIENLPSDTKEPEKGQDLYDDKLSAAQQTKAADAYGKTLRKARMDAAEPLERTQMLMDEIADLQERILLASGNKGTETAQLDLMNQLLEKQSELLVNAKKTWQEYEDAVRDVGFARAGDSGKRDILNREIKDLNAKAKAAAAAGDQGLANTYATQAVRKEQELRNLIIGHAAMMFNRQAAPGQDIGNLEFGTRDRGNEILDLTRRQLEELAAIEKNTAQFAAPPPGPNGNDPFPN